MYYVLKTLNLLCCNLVLLGYKIFYPRSFGCAFPTLAAAPFTIDIRRGGNVRLGRLKSRGALRLFADGGSIVVAENCFFNRGCSISSMASVHIGEGSLFGENVKIYDHDHVFTIEQGVAVDQFSVRPVRIGRNCWIGSNVIVLKGVDICDNVLVAAGCVVSRSIEKSGVYVNKGLTQLVQINA